MEPDVSHGAPIHRPRLALGRGVGQNPPPPCGVVPSPRATEVVLILPAAPPAAPWRPTLRSLFWRHPGLVLVPAIVAAAWFLDAWADKGPILCAFRWTTGLPCGGCGMTRAFAELAHGHLVTAVGLNLLSPFAFLAMLGWWGVAVVALLRGREVPQIPTRPALWAVAVVLGYWMGRVAWFFAQPDAWQTMQHDSPLMRWIGTWLNG
jgi:hypothetical protein